MKDVLAPWPYFAQDEIEAVNKVLDSGRVNYWTGDEGKIFEQEYAEFVGSKYAVAVANGTLALELALRSLDIGAGDEVIVTGRTFIASASAIVMCGATPVIVDVDPDSQNVTVATIQSAITPNTKAIITVHLAGWPCDMDPIIEIAKRNHLKVIEDCAQAHGAKYKGRPVGSMGDAAAFSFCQDKILTTGGEGGMFITNNKDAWKKAWGFKDHGKSYDAVFNRSHPPGFRWLHEDFGTNWRLTEMQSAIGRAQLRKLSGWVDKRRKHAAILSDHFAKIPALRVTIPSQIFSHSYYKYYTFIRPEYLKTGWNRDRIMIAINNEGIPCSSGACGEIYLEKAFEKANLGPKNRLPVARMLGETSLMFLVHPTLDEANMMATGRAVTKVMRLASG